MCENPPLHAMEIRIQLNGRPHVLPAGHSVARLIRDLGLATEQVAVERNRALVGRAQHERTVLEDGDRVEIVTHVGGG
jgi:sulfur carrier protein